VRASGDPGACTTARGAAPRDDRGMTTITPATTTSESTRSGWILFAGIVALIAGAYNALSGLSTLTTDYAAVDRAQEVLFGMDVDAWAWWWLTVGVLQIVTGFLVLARNLWGLFLGVCMAAFSAMVAVFAIFAWPLWAFSVLTLDLLVMYGLLTHRDEFD
jgi:uncharacterized membrane protein HdeD (DUF308 family)